MPLKRLLVTSWIVEEGDPVLEKARSEGMEIVVRRRARAYNEQEIADLLADLDVDGVVAGSDAYTSKVLAGAPRLKVISRTGVGYDSVDLPTAAARKIAVCATPGANHFSVADHAFGLLLAIARQIPLHQEFMKSEQWRRLTASDVEGKTLGILGLGKIGKGIAKRGRGFDMRVIAHDPYWDDEFARQHQVERMSAEQVIAEADFVTLHLPASAETRRFMNAERLAMMKPTAFLINTARGSLIDEDALCDALENHRIAGAALDVFDHEPPWGSRILKTENVVITPHVAGFSVNANAAMVRMAVENATLVLQGKKPHFCVNPEALD